MGIRADVACRGQRGSCRHCGLLQPSGAFEPDPAAGAPGPSADRQVLHRGHQHPGSQLMDKAAFQIGGEQVFELPVGKLSDLSGKDAPRSMGPVKGRRRFCGGHRPVAPRFQVEFAFAGDRVARSGPALFPVLSLPARCPCCASAPALLPRAISWRCCGTCFRKRR